MEYSQLNAHLEVIFKEINVISENYTPLSREFIRRRLFRDCVFVHCKDKHKEICTDLRLVHLVIDYFVKQVDKNFSIDKALEVTRLYFLKRSY